MEPEFEEHSLNKTWEEIRELDDTERWRDRNTIITKHEHKLNSRCINQLLNEIIEETLNSYFAAKDHKLTEAHDVIDNTTLPLITPIDFDDFLIDTNSEQQNIENPTTSEIDQIPLFPGDNEFKSASNFDFELSYFEQLNSNLNTDYIPRGSLFRTFDPFVNQPPTVCNPVEPQKTVPPNETKLVDVPPGFESVLDEVSIGEESSESETSDNKENSFCSCQTKFPEELLGDGLTSGDDYESTNEDYVNIILPDSTLNFNTKMSELVLSPLSKSMGTPNNFIPADLASNVIGIHGQDYMTDPIELDENITFTNTLPTENIQGQFCTPNIENEEFRPSHEVDLALEYLEDLDIGNNDHQTPRESLFTRFDPLTQQAIQPNVLLRRSSQLSQCSISPNRGDIPTKITNANLLTFSTPPKMQHTSMLPTATSKLVENESNSSEFPPNLTHVPHNNVIVGDSRSVLRYTGSEVRAEVQRTKESIRPNVISRKKAMDEFIVKEKLRLTEILDNERRKWKDSMKAKESELHRVKDTEYLSLTSVGIARSQIEAKHKAVQADFNLLKTKKEFFEEQLRETVRAVECFDERINELTEDTDTFKAKKSKVVAELDDMSGSLANFRTKISEANESIQLNLNRITLMTVKLEQTAKTTGEREKRFFHLEDRAMEKLKNANEMHEEARKQYKQNSLILKAELSTKQMELSELKLNIKKFESENENLQGIAKEIMEFHQPPVK